MLFLINENLQVVSIAFKAAQRSSQANGGQHLAGKNTLARRTSLNVLAYRILKTYILYCITSRAYANLRIYATQKCYAALHCALKS